MDRRDRAMQIEVGPARRPGNVSEIYDSPLRAEDFHVGPDGGITLTVDAFGINCQKSLYRYRLRLSAADAKRFASVALR